MENAIAGYVSTLINDGDTIQIGVGSTSEWCARLNTFDNKQDLGWYSEATPRGIIKLMREGVITSKTQELLKRETYLHCLRRRLHGRYAVGDHEPLL